MALNQQFIQLMVWLKLLGHLDSGRKVVEIGSQQLNDGFLSAKGDIEHLCRLFGVAPPSLPPPLAADGSRMLNPNAPYARAFYEALGYTYAYVDIDAPGGYPRDLNFDSVPAHLAGQHHLVTNFGTTEHVINQLNAFKIIHDLAAVGGIMIHELPSHGEVNHGFFAYQPKFFDRLAYSNGYDVLFFDFRWYEVEYGLADDVQRLIGRFVDTKQRPRFGASPSSVAVVLRKTRDAAFVPPLDVPYGTEAPDQAFEDRYGIALARRTTGSQLVHASQSYVRDALLRLPYLPQALQRFPYLREALHRLRRALRQ